MKSRNLGFFVARRRSFEQDALLLSSFFFIKIIFASNAKIYFLHIRFILIFDNENFVKETRRSSLARRIERGRNRIVEKRVTRSEHTIKLEENNKIPTFGSFLRT